MDIRGLRYFIKLAECLNFTHAAKECYITQTAMSQNIAKMEEELGFRLFKRNNRTVELTPAGRDFYGRAYILVKNYDEAVVHSSNLANGREGQLKVVVPSCMDGLTLMPGFKAFKKRYPAVDLKVQIVEPCQINDYLKQGRVDAAVCWPCDVSSGAEMETRIIAEFPIYVVAAATHPFAGCDRITLPMLCEEENILVDLKTGIGSEHSMGDLWLGEGLRPVRVTKKKNTEEVLLSVELDETIALLPGYLRRYISDAMVFLELDVQPRPVIQLAIRSMKNNLNPTLPKLIEILCDTNK